MRRLFALLPLLLGACSPLTAFNTVIPKDRGGVLLARDLAYGSHPRQRLDLYGPRKRAPGAKLPLIVWFYGGSWNSGSKDGYAFAGRALASRGFLVAVPDYRLVPEVRYPAFLQDSAAAVTFLRGNIGNFGGDPERLVLAGHSAGAYNAAMLALDPRWLGEGRSAVKGLIGLAGPYHFLPLDIAATQNAFGQAPDLPSTQPLNFAGAGDPPALLLHGADDTLVSPGKSTALAERLRQAGVAAESRLYPGIGHVAIMTAIAKPLRGKAPVLDDAAAFAHRVTAEN
ncbi:MAG TPA: alpha/beta hydrolase [Allosphingosinicella sp.]|jgi:acetyl esterase/lipase